MKNNSDMFVPYGNDYTGFAVCRASEVGCSSPQDDGYETREEAQAAADRMNAAATLGSITTAAKAKAAADNGKKGGRPAASCSYVIRRKRFFYGAKETTDLVGEQYAKRFATMADAKAWIAEAGEETYHQAQNEYGRPEYKVVRVDSLPAYLAYYL